MMFQVRERKIVLFLDLHDLQSQVPQQMTYKPGMEGIYNLYQTNVSAMPYMYSSAYVAQRIPPQVNNRYANGMMQDAPQNIKRVGVMNNQVFDSKVYPNSEMLYDANYIQNAYSPYGFSNHQPAFQYANLSQAKRDLPTNGQYPASDNHLKKQHVQQPSQVVYVPQINSLPYGTHLYQNLPAVYQLGARSSASYAPAKTDAGSESPSH